MSMIQDTVNVSLHYNLLTTAGSTPYTKTAIPHSVHNNIINNNKHIRKVITSEPLR